MKHLEKLMAKKKDGPLDPNYKKAKMSMLGNLQNEMSGMMKDELQNGKMKKVEVAADDKEGLAHGLDKAKELLGQDSEPEDSEDEDDKGSMGEHSYSDESGEEDKEPAEEMIADQIKHEGAEDELSEEDIEELMQLLQEMKMKKGL